MKGSECGGAKRGGPVKWMHKQQEINSLGGHKRLNRRKWHRLVKDMQKWRPWRELEWVIKKQYGGDIKSEPEKMRRWQQRMVREAAMDQEIRRPVGLQDYRLREEGAKVLAK